MTTEHENCPQCGKPASKLTSILALDQAVLNGWQVECCSKCKAAIKRRNAQRRAAQERQYKKK
jgi:hypothetical protein